jgi:hypothetical protein
MKYLSDNTFIYIALYGDSSMCPKRTSFCNSLCINYVLIGSDVVNGFKTLYILCCF